LPVAKDRIVSPGQAGGGAEVGEILRIRCLGRMSVRDEVRMSGGGGVLLCIVI